jgi:hypothetical protein
VFSLISLYSQTPGSTLLPVFSKMNKVEKIDKLTDEHHIKKKSEEKKRVNKEKTNKTLF